MKKDMPQKHELKYHFRLLFLGKYLPFKNPDITIGSKLIQLLQ